MIKDNLKNIYTLIYEKLEFEACKIYAKNSIPIYYYHIRKTGGTSINGAFLKYFGFNFPEDYDVLSKKHNNRLLKKRKAIIGWNLHNIGTGAFNYAFSHSPYHEVILPDNAFKFTCLRDPLKRLLSHYGMLVFFKQNNILHKSSSVEKEWIGENFKDFLENIPKKHLLNQLYMFSKDFDPLEAATRIKSLDYYFFTEHFENGMQQLGDLLDAKFEVLREKSFAIDLDVDESDKELAMTKLDEEYKMINLLQ